MKEIPLVYIISNSDELAQAFKIRAEVFMNEQSVTHEEEFDEFDQTSKHFLAVINKKPAGTSRYRKTDNGFKLERFAVLKEFRKMGVGTILMQEMLSSIKNIAPLVDRNNFLYLHAQVAVVPFYLKFGFKKSGEIFSEAGIDHIKMTLTI